MYYVFYLDDEKAKLVKEMAEAIVDGAENLDALQNALADIELRERYNRMGGLSDKPVTVYEGEDALEQLRSADIFGGEGIDF